RACTLGRHHCHIEKQNFAVQVEFTAVRLQILSISRSRHVPQEYPIGFLFRRIACPASFTTLVGVCFQDARTHQLPGSWLLNYCVRCHRSTRPSRKSSIGYLPADSPVAPTSAYLHAGQ